MLSLRRRHSRWRMFPILFLFLGLICSGELAPIRVPEATSTSSSTPKRKSDIGSLSDFSWQAWLLVDTQGGFQPGMDSATLLRRITPKSVFIAPELAACAEGYRADSMGRCVKSVNINANAHMNFILERLKVRFPQAKNDQKKSTGPLQLNIPLQVSDTDPQSTNVELEETSSTNQPIAVPIRNATHFAEDKETKPHEANLYEVKNDTTLDEEASTFFLENSSTDDVEKVDQKSDVVVPVADFVEETNDTNLSEVVDYKIPIDLKALLNSSNLKRVNMSDSTEEGVSMAEKRQNSTEMSPTLVLLISPTKLTNVVDDLPSTQNDTVEQIAQMSNFTLNMTKENLTVSAPNSALPPTKQLTSIPLDEQRDNETYTEDEMASETSKPDQEEEQEFLYDDREPFSEYSDVPDDEDSAEGEEILKHGEAGMTIPTRNVERLDRDRVKRKQNKTADIQKMFDRLDQIMIRFNDSALTEDKDEAGSNVSSEVSIDGDLILETTLLDVNTERLQTTTKSPDATQKIVRNNDDVSKESFSKSPDIEPEVVFSEAAHSALPINSHGRERIEQLSSKIENERNEELEAAPSSSESLLYDPPEEDPITEIRTIDEEQSNAKESESQERPKDIQSNVPATSLSHTMNLGSAEDFVRFPNYERQPQQGNYVRFPSREANSIHNPSYKQNSRYPADDLGPYGGTSTKSSVPVRQKPVYYLTSSSWKADRSQPDRVQATASERQKQRPDLLRFWRNMPLFRDPAIYPVDQNDEAANDDQEQSHDRFFRTRLSRKGLLTETSPGSRLLTQKRRTPIGV